MALPSKRVSTSLDSGDQAKRHKSGSDPVIIMEKDHSKPVVNKINSNVKLETFKKESLQDCVDYISLQSSLSLLRSRLTDIKRDIKELNGLKQNIKASEDVKAITKLISSNSDYLNEISYKGSFIKCPEIDWKNDYGLELDELQSNDDDLTKINDSYEIIKRDALFGYDKLK